MVTTNTIRLDVTKPYTQPINLVQYEVDGREFNIYLSANSTVINLTGASVSFYAKKPDGNILFNACTVVTAALGYVTYKVTEQTCAADGTLECFIIIVKSGEETRSLAFDVVVAPSDDVSSAVESTSEYTALDVALSTVANMVTYSGTSTAGNIPAYTDVNGDEITDSGVSAAEILTALGNITTLINNPCGARWDSTSGQNVATASDTTIDFATATDSYGNLPPTRASAGVYTINKAGRHIITAQVSVGTNSSGYRQLTIQAGGTTVATAKLPPVAASGTHINVTAYAYLAASAKVTAKFLQDSGSTLSVAAAGFLSIIRCG